LAIKKKEIIAGWLPNNRTRAGRPLPTRTWKTRAKAGEVVVEAVQCTDGLCPYYTEGQKIVISPLDKEDSDDICMPMFCTFSPFWRPLAYGVTPKELGMTMEDADPNVGFFTCHVCPVGSTPPRQSHANVIFKVYTRPRSNKIRQHGPNAEKTAELRKKGMWYPPYWPIDEE
jgi:uncharacterized repeat protein (TIGR04076 family)